MCFVCDVALNVTLFIVTQVKRVNRWRQVWQSAVSIRRRKLWTSLKMSNVLHYWIKILVKLASRCDGWFAHLPWLSTAQGLTTNKAVFFSTCLVISGGFSVHFLGGSANSKREWSGCMYVCIHCIVFGYLYIVIYNERKLNYTRKRNSFFWFSMLWRKSWVVTLKKKIELCNEFFHRSVGDEKLRRLYLNLWLHDVHHTCF